MGVDFLSPVRLLRKKWTDATELAQELFAMSVSRQTRQVGSPLEIVAPPGQQPGLKIRRQQPGEADLFPAAAAPGRAIAVGEPYRPNPAVKVGHEQQPKAPVPQLSGQPRGGDQAAAIMGALLRIAQPPPPGGQGLASAQTPVLPPDTGTAAARPANQLRPPFSPPPLSAGQIPRQTTGPARPLPTQTEAGPLSDQPVLATVPQGGDQRRQIFPPSPFNAPILPVSARSPEQPPIFPPGTRPHVNPVVDVEGPVSFRGKEPVQFDTPPLVWSSGKAIYEPVMTGDGVKPPTHIPWGQNLCRVCQIGSTDIPAAAGGSGTPLRPGSGQAKIYNFIDQNMEDASTGSSPDTVYNYSPVAIPKNSWQLAINVQENWFVIAASGGGTFAKSGGGGVPAMSGSTPGSGTVTLYTMNDGGSLDAGDTVTAYNIGTTAVGANKFLVLINVAGKWVVDVEPC